MKNKEPLTQERLKQLLDYNPDTGVFSWKVAIARRVNIGDIAGSPNYRGYLLIGVDGDVYRAHRLAWLYMYGTFPFGMTDHINGVHADNRINNLRDVSAQINNQNRRVAFKTNKASGVLGVYRNKNRWRAMIGCDGKMLHLGNYGTIEEASAAYIDAKRKLHAGCMI